jgi:hypothetical protein
VTRRVAVYARKDVKRGKGKVHMVVVDEDKRPAVGEAMPFARTDCGPHYRVDSSWNCVNAREIATATFCRYCG